MSRLVFGESLSPDEILAVQRASDISGCLRDMRGNWGLPSAEACRTCRYREPCATRRDDPAAAARAAVFADEVIRRECIHGERKCNRYPFCGHAPTQREIMESFAEDG